MIIEQVRTRREAVDRSGLERGETLRFFRGIHVVVEALAALGRVPARV
ncbi:hypothetical protein ACQPZQ_08145 [Pseudonocardia sp. CA-142604]